MQHTAKDILEEDNRRRQQRTATFNPITGQGAGGERTAVHIDGVPPYDMYLPTEQCAHGITRLIIRAGGIDKLMQHRRLDRSNTTARLLIIERFTRERIQYDFPFWCAAFVRIKPKGGGKEIPFRLNRPQLRLYNDGFRAREILNEPVRVILLKARQWGGSTCTDMFCAWLQLVHDVGLNALIAAQVKDAANNVVSMYRRMIENYPVRLLYPIGEPYDAKADKWKSADGSPNVHEVPQRKCKIKVGTAEKPDSCRGDDYNLVHCTEVGVWRTTDGRTPEDIIDAATGGMLYAPRTLIVYESTAKGTGTFFHREWIAAKNGTSQFRPFFVAWYEIEQYTLPFGNEEQRNDFARQLIENRDSEDVPSDREEPGAYLWRLWQQGATLDAIHWYVSERRKYRDHAHMASEYPSDDIEAFTHSGAHVFDTYHVDALRPLCRAPLQRGDIAADAIEGNDALHNIHFVPGGKQLLWLWHEPEHGDDVLYRYIVAVDIGGRSAKADFSVIAVFDRYDMIDDGRPEIVAQWRGHCDHDRLAWKAAQIAAWYDNALLVIESNTLETKDREQEGHAGFILDRIKEAYPNLYERSAPPEDIREGVPRRYGFHTNVKTKAAIIDNLIVCVRERLYVEHDARALDEFLTYEEKDGVYAAVTGAHDDILMTRAIGLWVCLREMPRPKIVDTRPGAKAFAAAASPLSY